MKVVILAGGLGSRLAEETESKPKPMVTIGSKPILWHIMKSYGHFGFNDFAIALGYKGEVVKRYFTDYATLEGDLRLRFDNPSVERARGSLEPWTIDLVDTGANTNTGGRVKRCAHLLDERFMLTYGDGVSNIDLAALLDFHQSHGKLCTLTAVRPPARFGHLNIDGDRVSEFSEKPQVGEGWINGGFMVCEPEVLNYIEGDHINLAHAPLERLSAEGQLMAYRHHDFWQCMDTIRDRELLESLWESSPPWQLWP